MTLNPDQGLPVDIPASLVRAINRYLLVETKVERADLGLLFGGRRSAAARVERAAWLWHRGLFDRIAVSGGRTNGARFSEAEAMGGMLAERGVPKEAILIEDRSTHTGENVAFTISLLKRLGLYDDIRSVIAVGRLSASRRYLMTLQQHWPSVTKMLVAANYHDVEPTSWHTNDDLRREVLGEWRKLRPYLDAQFIREIDAATCPVIKASSNGPTAP